MAFRWTSIGHFFATVASDIVKGSKVLVTVGQKIENAAPTIESITDVVYPAAGTIERAAFAVLGEVISAAQASSDAAGASGLNVSLDATLVADIKALIPSIEQYMKTLGIAKPTAGQTVTGK